MTRRKNSAKLCVFLILITSFIAASTASSSSAPSAAVLGRYVLWNDVYWNVVNKTVQQLSGEGYSVQGEPSQLVYVNYSRLNYTFKSKIIQITWPNATVEITEGEYDLNVTVYSILGNGSIGGRIGSFLRQNQPARTGRTYDTWAPSFGPGFDPSILQNGYNFTLWTEYHVTGPETIYSTPRGQNTTYVLTGEKTNSTMSIKNRVWCDATSGIILKQVLDQKFASSITHEEQMIVETGIEEVNPPFPSDLLLIGVSLAIIVLTGITIYTLIIKRKKT